MTIVYRPDWELIYSGCAHTPDGDQDLVEITKETARCAELALKKLNNEDFYAQNGVAESEISSVLFNSSNAQDHQQSADKIERLRAALEPFKSGEWGTVLAWIVAGAPSRDEGVAAAKQIVKWQSSADEALGLSGR